MLLIKDYMKELEQEVEWLRYFYSEARYGMGTADSEIYRDIKECYTKCGNVLPELYRSEE